MISFRYETGDINNRTTTRLDASSHLTHASSPVPYIPRRVFEERRSEYPTRAYLVDTRDADPALGTGGAKSVTMPERRSRLPTPRAPTKDYRWSISVARHPGALPLCADAGDDLGAPSLRVFCTV